MRRQKLRVQYRLSQYDLAGNQTTVGTYTQTYDAENRQVSSTTSGGTVTNYIYDGLGHRVEKINTTANTETIYVYAAAGELAAEYSTTAPIPAAKPVS